MRLARYIGNGAVEICEEPMPTCPPCGLLVKTDACGLCSGELMSWYMDQKIPHVLGHEVCGTIIESESARFPVGSRVFSHHHAPCLECEYCRLGRFVHCSTWRETRLLPGGMAEFFAVASPNLTDTFGVSTLDAQQAALIEPVACVVKSIRTGATPQARSAAVVGLGSMGLVHMSLLQNATGYDVASKRVAWAREHGFRAFQPHQAEPADTVYVCPGSQSAFDLALAIVEPGGTIVLFAPLPPGECLQVPQSVYFRDLRIAHAYSCGPDDTQSAAAFLQAGQVRPQAIVSDFIELEQLPDAYRRMKAGEILKAMVLF